jgi:hypothetical protein
MLPTTRSTVEIPPPGAYQLPGPALTSRLITREHLARYLPRSPSYNWLDGLIADVFAGKVIDGPEPSPVMLDFQAHLGASVFRYPAHTLTRLPHVRFQAGVSFFVVYHCESPLPASRRGLAGCDMKGPARVVYTASAPLCPL